jgi:hypothetical protein
MGSLVVSLVSVTDGVRSQESGKTYFRHNVGERLLMVPNLLTCKLLAFNPSTDYR